MNNNQNNKNSDDMFFGANAKLDKKAIRSRQSRFDARYWMLGAGALGRPRGMVWGGRREEGSGWGTHV